jgi:hypothetical protein
MQTCKYYGNDTEHCCRQCIIGCLTAISDIAALPNGKTEEDLIAMSPEQLWKYAVEVCENRRFRESLPPVIPSFSGEVPRHKEQFFYFLSELLQGRLPPELAG